jgi:hypothetical protein
VAVWKAGVVDPFDHRVEKALGDMPGPDEQASDRARRAALDALPTPTVKSRRRLPLLMAAALVVGLAGGGAMAAIGGALRDDASSSPPSKTPQPVPESVPGKITAPPRGVGVAALVNGKLWLATRGGLTIEGLPASAAALSPHAKFVVIGLGHSLVAMAPDGRRAWSLPTAGPVTGVAWAPNPIWVAYIVATRDGTELWLVEGNGENPRRVARDVGGWSSPSWRPDSEAVGYVDAKGRAMVYHRGTGAVSPVGPKTCFGRIPAPVVEMTFSPSGGEEARVAYITRGGEVVASGPGGVGGGCRAGVRDLWSLTSLGWISESDFVVASRPRHDITAPNSYLYRYRATARGVEERGNASIGAGAIMLHVSPALGDRMLVMIAGDPRRYPADFGPRVMQASRMELWWVRVPPTSGTVPAIHSRGTLLRLEGWVVRQALSQPHTKVSWR